MNPQDSASAADEDPITPDEGPITADEFDQMVERALERIPQKFRDAMENVAILVEDQPPANQRGLLGLYQGVPLPKRGRYGGSLPDTITIFQRPIVRLYRTRERVEHEVYRTLVHEVGHYFGFEEGELHALGWG